MKTVLECAKLAAFAGLGGYVILTVLAGFFGLLLLPIDSASALWAAGVFVRSTLAAAVCYVLFQIAIVLQTKE